MELLLNEIRFHPPLAEESEIQSKISNINHRAILEPPILCGFEWNVKILESAIKS